MSVSTPWFCISCHDAAPAPEKNWDLQCMNAFDLLMRMISHTLNQSKQFLKALHHQQLISGMKPDTLAKTRYILMYSKCFELQLKRLQTANGYIYMTLWAHEQNMNKHTSLLPRWLAGEWLQFWTTFALKSSLGVQAKQCQKTSSWADTHYHPCSSLHCIVHDSNQLEHL